MYDFIDKTSTVSGTLINRTAMMAIQGFQGKTTVFNDDGTITETNSLGQRLITGFDNVTGSVVETFIGDKTIQKVTSFNNVTGEITETIQEIQA